MKKLIFVVGFLLAASNCFSETGPNRNVTNVYATDESATFTIPGAALECSKEFSTKFVISEADNINFWITSTSSSSSPSLTYVFEQSVQPTTSATSGTSDTAYLATDTLYSGTSERIQIATVDTISGIYGRVCIQGAAANPADTQATIKMVK